MHDQCQCISLNVWGLVQTFISLKQSGSNLKIKDAVMGGDISAGHGSVYLDGRSHKFHRISAVIHTPARHRDAAGYYGRELSFQQKHYHTLPMSFVSISVMNGTLSMGTSTITSSLTRYQQCCNIRMVLIRHLSLHAVTGTSRDIVCILARINPHWNGRTGKKLLLYTPCYSWSVQ